LTEPIYLKQILINLCSNASKFTNAGYIHIDVGCDKTFRNIRIDVSDSGIGMTSREVESVFDPFIQGDSTTTREYGGTGLGLAISNRLASAIDGSLGCVSEPGKGSCFTLEFMNHTTGPFDIVNNLEEVQAQVDITLEQAKIKQLSGHILLVEDSPDNQQLIAMYIRKTGAYLDIAADGQAGVDMALNNDYDLILMDMQMPVLDGLEAITRLRNNNYTGPIVSLTANAMLTNRENCLVAGANDYLVKPIDLSQFYEVLNRYLHNDSNDGDNIPADQGTFDDYYNSPGYLKIVERFRKKLPNIVEELSEAVRKEDWNDVQVKSHDLKGIGGAVQLPEITEVAGRMNVQVINKQYELVATTNAELNNLYRKIIRKDDQEPLVH
jgi:CheY-like chemotaxis protein/HPt (histidine-containing phosphotransfer) domain-containing protein